MIVDARELALDPRAAEVTSHTLVAVSAAYALCSCGERVADTDAFLGHVREVVEEMYPLPPSHTDARLARNRDRLRAVYKPRPNRRARGEIARTKRVLAAVQAEHDALDRLLAETGITGFSEQLEWLHAHESPLRRLARQRRWALAYADVTQISSARSRATTAADAAERRSA